ncbi:MAG TPA: hypothetical protein VIX14_06150 [Terriglobales bacterium]
MRRVHFFEFHDQPWFPSSLRDYVTDALQFGFNLLKSYAPIAPLLQSALDSAGNGPNAGRSVIDMCSGGGGPWFDLSRRLQIGTRGGRALPADGAEPRHHASGSAGLQVWLTDKYPNLKAFQSARAASENRIAFYPESVDATKVPRELKGLRTMFTSFHHFSPDDARAILQDAVDAGESIAIFEVPRRAWSTISLTFAFVFMLFIGTPWVRPFRWSRLLWTYLVPILPLVLLFDGVVSCLRTYRPRELREMVEKLSANEYQWEMGEQPSGKVPITFLIGYPGASSREFVR